jgi:hypothetical protein
LKKIISIFVLILFSTQSLGADNLTTYTFKKYNLQIKIPYLWRWKKENPEKKGGLFLLGYSPDNKYQFTIWVNSTRSLNTVRSFYKYLRKGNINLEEEPYSVDETFLNLKQLNGYMAPINERVGLKTHRGYLFTASNGIWMFTGKLVCDSSEYANNLEMLKEVLYSFSSNLNMQEYCCAKCIEGKNSGEKSEVCSDLVSDEPCNIFLKNFKTRISECGL